MSEIVGTLASIAALIEVVVDCCRILGGTWISSKKGPKIGDELRILEKVLAELMSVVKNVGANISSQTLDLVTSCIKDCMDEITKFRDKMDPKSKEKGINILSYLQRQQTEKTALEFFTRIERRKTTLTLLLAVSQLAISLAIASNQTQPYPVKCANEPSTQTELDDVVEVDRRSIRSATEDTPRHPSKKYSFNPRAVISKVYHKVIFLIEGDRYAVKDQEKIGTLADTHHCHDKERTENFFSPKAWGNFISSVVIKSNIKTIYSPTTR